MFFRSTDADWERLGETEPYWAVISQDGNRRAVLTPDARRRFYESGEAYVDRLWRVCRRRFGEDFAPGRVLDFGCGLGRVAIPLARRSQSVVAADVAASMLREARKAVDEQGGLGNVDLVQCDDSLTGIKGPFDLVHSLMVFQHVPSRRGLKTIERLLDLVGPAGSIVIHVLFYNPHEKPFPERALRSLVRYLRRPFRRTPVVEMHAYPMNHVFRLLHDAGFKDLHLEITEHAGHLGVMCMGRLDPPA